MFHVKRFNYFVPCIDFGFKSGETSTRSAAKAENLGKPQAFGECESGSKEFGICRWSTAKTGRC